MPNKAYIKSSVALAIALSITGCSTLMNPNEPVEANQIALEKSYLETNEAEGDSQASDVTESTEVVEEGSLKRVSSLSDSQKQITMEVDLAQRFSSDKKFQVSVNALPLNDFIHYTFGELLGVSYFIEPSVKSNKTPVTLELKEKVSTQKLFQLVRQILSRNNINISLNNDIFYLHPIAKGAVKSNKAFGFGRSVSSVPNVSSVIVQLVPIHYSLSAGIQKTLNSLVDAGISVDVNQGLLTVTGTRESVLRTLEIVRLLDSPTLYNKAIGLVSFSYIDSATFVDKLTLLLSEEGIKVGSRFTGKGSVSFIPIEHLGQMVVFASSDEIIDRVDYWRKELDKPASGAEQSFYIYHPRFARATDLGQSIAPLIGGKLTSGNNKNSNTPQQSRENNQQLASQPSTSSRRSSGEKSIEGDNMRLVVDERANALIFYATGQHYQELQPIIKQLDTVPKQVMLEVVIAEVKLTGSFSKGVEFALSSGGVPTPTGSNNTTRSLSFNGENGFSYSVVGIDGNVNLNLNQTDGLINVLSRPTLLVRDGVSANISVGDDIPTIGSTTTDPIGGERQTTTIQYRKTGVNLNVTPTINAQGTIIMTIDQNISNVSAAGGIEGTPAIFERTITTEVVSADGQSVLLGGLISQNLNSSASQVPFLGELPLLGHLFRTDSEESDKTELVVLVTPKIINDTSDWEKVKKSFIE